MNVVPEEPKISTAEIIQYSKVSRVPVVDNIRCSRVPRYVAPKMVDKESQN